MAAVFLIDVADHGPGIPDAEKDKVLQRFGRGSAGAGTTGSGLGLAIVKAVTDAHGGALRLLDRPGGGLIVRLEFPPATRPAAGQPAAMRAGVSLPILLGGLLALSVCRYRRPRRSSRSSIRPRWVSSRFCSSTPRPTAH